MPENRERLFISVGVGSRWKAGSRVLLEAYISFSWSTCNALAYPPSFLPPTVRDETLEERLVGRLRSWKIILYPCLVKRQDREEEVNV